MAGPCEFSLESVRQYMLMRDGQVTNHELVKHFRAWLTHPTQKEISRQKFKEYVNTLATIRQEEGEKYLVLKQKFYPKFEEEDEEEEEPSLLDEVMASYAPIASRTPPSARPPDPPQATAAPPPRRQLPPLPVETHRAQPPPRSQSRASLNQPPPPPLPPYRAPPAPRAAPQANDVGLPLPAEYGLPAPRQGVFHPPQYGQEMVGLPPPQLPYPPALPSRRESVSSSGISRSSSMMSVNAPPPSVQPRSSVHSHLPQQPRAAAAAAAAAANMPHSNSGSSTNSSTVSRKNSCEEPDVSSSDSGKPPPQPKQQQRDEKISVKERTKTFNRMASEIDLAQQAVPKPSSSSATHGSSMGVKRRNSRAATERRVSAHVGDDESNDSSSISTLDQTAKQWMVRVAQGDYHTIAKMLLDDPRLAKHKDFVSGYTGLHWAAKHGNLDTVKLLAGSYSVDVNQKSHGGYTSLHLACQFGHQEVFDVLVKAYGADPHVRDNSGKTARQYLVGPDQAMGLSMSSDTFRQLKDRRRLRRQNGSGGGKSHSSGGGGGGGGGMLRFGSLSVKVKKTTEAFNNYFNHKFESDSGSGSGLGPISLPMELVGGGGTGPFGSIASGNDESRKAMPPPKFAPSGLKKRKSKRSADHARNQSSPATPTERSPIKEESLEDLKRISAAEKSDSDSEYGFDSQWAPR